MASPVSLHLPDVGDAVGAAVARAVAQDMETTEQALSRFRASAELVALNSRAGSWTQVSDRLYRALSAAWQAHRHTGGLFDPRVLDWLEAYGYAGAPRSAGGSAETSGHWLQRLPRGRKVLLATPVDLGGIGKGLGVRWAAAIPRHVSGNFLLNAGGDLIAEGDGPAGHGWQVGVEDPLNPGELKAALQVRGTTAVCTSSIARLRWRHGEEEVHHLIDPRSGRPGGEGILAVTVIGQDPAWAEVWSKALFLHGQGGIAQAAQGHRALWISRDGTLDVSDEALGDVFWQR